MALIINTVKVMGYSALELAIGGSLSLIWEYALPYVERNINKYTTHKDIVDVIIQASGSIIIGTEVRNLLLGDTEAAEIPLQFLTMFFMSFHNKSFWKKLDRIKKRILHQLQIELSQENENQPPAENDGQMESDY